MGPPLPPDKVEFPRIPTEKPDAPGGKRRPARLACAYTAAMPTPASPATDTVRPCPLCAATDTVPWHRDARRDYHRCAVCALVFVPREQHLAPAAEAAVYAHHDNRLDDPGYRRFLARLATPVLAGLPALRERLGLDAQAPLAGIDIGCGPAPLLAQMLGEQGVRMAVWDPLYATDRAPLAQRYHLVTASEVVEHFREPAAGFAQLFALLRPGGLLAVMTKRTRDRDAFARWHYIQDPTHIAFYGEQTFGWLAAHYGASLAMPGDDVVVFQLPAGENAAMPEHHRS